MKIHNETMVLSTIILEDWKAEPVHKEVFMHLGLRNVK